MQTITSNKLKHKKKKKTIELQRIIKKKLSTNEVHQLFVLQ